MEVEDSSRSNHSGNLTEEDKKPEVIGWEAGWCIKGAMAAPCCMALWGLCVPFGIC